jgi:hypothetical protein
MDKPIIDVTLKRSISYQIMYVYRANFNDEYYLERYKFDINEIPKDRLIWIDPFFGRSKQNNIEVAIKYISDDEIIILEKKDNIIKEHQADTLMDIIICEDYDKSKLLACHISLTI